MTLPAVARAIATPAALPVPTLAAPTAAAPGVESTAAAGVTDPLAARAYFGHAPQASDVVQIAEQTQQPSQQPSQELAQNAKLPTDPSANVRDALGAGKQLPGDVRQKAEKALDTSLAGVRVHEGDAAEALADVHEARAFAQGADIVLGQGAQTGGEKDAILAEEIVHVVQMGGRTAADRGATGKSNAQDPEEQRARAMAQQVLAGARVQASLHGEGRKALYRNDGPAPTPAPAPPDHVTLTLAGKSVTVRLGALQPGTTEKMATMPDPGIPGLKLERQVKLRFGENGQLTGGTAWANVTLGKAAKGQAIALRIDSSGQIDTALPQLSLVLGGLLDVTATGQIGPTGVTAHARAGAADIHSEKLQKWLRDGALDLSVDAHGTVTGGGSLGLHVDPFGDGTLRATLNGEALSGTATVQNTAEIPLGTGASAKAGTLTGTLDDKGELQLKGPLALEIPALGQGTGKLNVDWTSAQPEMAGTATYAAKAPSTLGKTVLQSAQVTGTLETGKLGHVQGTGAGTFDGLVTGTWNGSFDLEKNTGTYTLQGALTQPIVQGEVTVEKGALTLGVADDVLTTTAGQAAFKLGNELLGTAVLETGTTQKEIHAVATAALVSPRNFGEVTVSKGAMTVKVLGAQVEIAGGTVDFTFRDVAKGKLGLEASADVRQLTGAGKAAITKPQTWGDIAVQSASIQVGLKDNHVETAAGVAQMTWKDVAKGQIAFDGLQDFNAINGAASVKLSKNVPLTSPLQLVADDKAAFQVEFANSQTKQLAGNFAWQYEGFKGQIASTQAVEDLQQLSGTGKADVLAPFAIAEVGGKKLLAETGSSLTGTLEGGRFVGVRGTLNWQYDGWLAGEAIIPTEKTDIKQIDGTLKAQVIAAKALPNNAKVVAQPGEKGALSVEISDSTPKRYAGRLNYLYDSFLKGQVNVSGEKLDFSLLEGKSTAEVVAEKQLPNVKLLAGGHLAVEFTNSEFDAFSGSAAFRYADWLEGVATPAEKDGASLSAGLAGPYTAQLAKTFAGDNDFWWRKGSQTQGKLTPGVEINRFDAGSQMGWKSGKWLGGTMTLKNDASLRGPTETSPASVLKAYELSGDPKISLLPSSGLTVDLTMGSVAKVTGNAAAQLEQWAKGTLAIENGSTEQVSGQFTGAISGEKPLANGETTLVPGGNIQIPVQANRAGSISGEIPFRYGAGTAWLRGILHGHSNGAGVDSLAGDVQGGTITTLKQLSGGMALKTGGHLQMPMVASHLDQLGGEANFAATDSGVPEVFGGVLNLQDGSTPNLVDGDWHGNIQKELKISPTLTLLPSGGMTGQVAQNAVTKISGPVGFRVEEWLAGKLEVTDSDPHAVAGTGKAAIAQRVEIIPGKLWLTPGGNVDATLAGGQLTAIHGEVPFAWADWLTGTVTVEAGSRTSIAGPVTATVVGPGTNLGPVQLLPGGSLKALLTPTGVDQFSGTANIAYGKANDGSQWHVEGAATVEAASTSTFRGEVTGRLASERKLPPSLVLKKGGNLGAKIEGAAISQLSGEVAYAFAPGGSPMLEGGLKVSADSTAQEISGQLTGRIAAPIQAGPLTIQPGGALEGDLQRNFNVKLAGHLAAELKGVAKGTIAVDGQFDPNQAKVSGKMQGELLADQQIGPLKLKKGSGLGAQIEQNALTEIWGNLGAKLGDLSGTVNVPEEKPATLQSISGTAALKLDADKPVGDGQLVVRAGSAVTGSLENNELGTLHGKLQWKYANWLIGLVNADIPGDFSTLSGKSVAALAAEKRVGQIALQPGGKLTATLANGQLTSVGGELAWQYGDAGWLRGTLKAAETGTLETLTADAKATIALPQRAGDHLLLEAGGALTTRIDAGQLQGVTGDVSVLYDDWLRGKLHVQTSDLQTLSGQVSASLLRHQPLGDVTLRRGGNLQVDVQGNALKSLSGQVGWQYKDALEGNVQLEPSTPEALTGTATASLRQPTPLAGGLELQRGGSLTAKLAASKVTEIAGNVPWRYGGWLKGEVTLAAGADLNAPSGSAQASVATTKTLGNWTLLQGGNLQAKIAAGQVETLGGQASVRWQDWLDGNAELQEGKPDSWQGRAQLGVRLPHEVSAGLTLERGGQVALEIDAKKPATEATASGKLAILWQNWLKGEVELQSSPLGKPTGQATATLATDKQIGNVLLRRGGDVRLDVQAGQVKTLTGAVNWQYGDWLGGTLRVQTPMAPESLEGKATATLLAAKNLPAGVKLLPGGQLDVTVAGGQPKELGGKVRYGLGNWLEGAVTLEPTGSLDNVTGQGHAQVIAEKALTGNVKVRPGSLLEVQLQQSQLAHVKGGVKWQYADWLAGTAEIDAEKLETLEGKADARLLVEKPLAGGAKLLPGGQATVQFASGEPTNWSGTLGWKYGEWLTGRVEIAGQNSLQSLNGEAEVRVAQEKVLGGGFVLARGGTLKTPLVDGKPGGLTGEVHVRYQDWLDGGLKLENATLDALNGELNAAVLAEHPLAGSGLTLQRGGHVEVDIQAGKLGDAQGEVPFAYKGAAVGLDGTLTLQKSPLNRPTGTAQARLTQETRPFRDTVLLPGGAVELNVQNGRPTSLGGRLEWRYNTWLAGSVELPKNTAVMGPLAGEATAHLLQDKALNSRLTLQQGGNIHLQLNTAQPVVQNQVSGLLGVQLDDWLHGSVQVESGSTLGQLTGSAHLSLQADKAVSESVTLKKGGAVEAQVAQNRVANVSGLALVQYDKWLAGSVHLEPTADLKNASGDATLQLSEQKTLGQLALQKGGDVRARMDAGKIAHFGGMLDWQYENWLRGNLTVDGQSTWQAISGTGAALVTTEKTLGPDVTLKPGGQVRAIFASSHLDKLSGHLAFQWQKWVDGSVEVQRESDPATLAGQAQVHTLVDKQLAPGLILLKGTGASATLENATLSKWSGQLGVRVQDFVEGRVQAEGAGELADVHGAATVAVIKEKPLGSRLDLLKGGTLDGQFDGKEVTNVHGAAAVRYDKWLTGTVTAQGEGGLDHLGGHGALRVDADARVGLLTLKKGSALEADFADNVVTNYRGNVDMTLDSWLTGNLRFEGADLHDVSGQATLDVTRPKALLGPLSIQPGSRLRAGVAHSQLADFGGMARLNVRGWGQGELGIQEGSTLERVSGAGKMELTQPKKLGSIVTLTRASLGAEVTNNELTAVWGRADGEIKGFGTGWVQLEKNSQLDTFSGQAGFKLTTPRKIGQFAELSGGEILANFQNNELKSLGGKADVTVYGWGKGSVQLDAGSTLESLKGAASLKLTEPKSLAGGKVRITGGEVNALVEGQQLRQVAGNVEIELPGIARGRVAGELDLARDTFSGQGQLQQIKAWTAGPATVTDATLMASVVEGRLASASGSARIDAGKLGKGAFQVNYEDTGSGALLYGSGEIQFKPHERVQGTLAIQVSRDQQLTGQGELDVQVSDKIRGKAQAALGADGHVKLAGSVTMPGPFEIFKPDPWKKDLKLLDTSFLVYTPPNVKVKVGAGIGMEVGVKPLTLRNLTLGGQVDLMDPSFASMSVSGQLSSAAYADLNAYVEGSVEVSAVVVAVQAGLRAALNLHLEAGIEARPTMTVNRRGLGFDMPVDARLSAALNLILTFFAKVKVGLDVGLFSIMETVWQYDKSPDPLKLGEMAVGAKGRLQADASGMRATMNPEYNPPDLSIEGLKKALRL